LRREPLEPVEAVRRLVALQAQESASPYLALWNRIAGFDASDLDAAFADRTVVRATLMRITLHAVHAEDYPAFHDAMRASLRASRLYDRRFTATGLSIPEVDALLPELASFVARPRTGAEVEDLLHARLGDRGRKVWWALRTFAPVHRAPSGGPWSFSGPASFVAGTTRDVESPDESIQRLLHGYLRAYGPATVADFAQFTLLRRPVITKALQALGDRVERLAGPAGEPLFDVPGSSLPPEDVPAPPRLLPMWDSVLLAYADRSRVIPADHRPLVQRRNGDVLPALLVDGYVAGVWRPVEGGIEATAFARLDDEAWAGLAAEAAALVKFLTDREPTVYGRYAHWWTKPMPKAQTRLLPG
jgi:Winged helix DNA-binding domain